MFTINDCQLTKHFKLSEFVCKDGSNRVVIDMDLVNELQKLRNFINKPIVITSGYRTPKYNAEIGGATNSMHMLGKAVDIYVHNMSSEELYYIARHFNFKGFGIYDNWLHLDVRLDKLAVWDNRKSKKRKLTF